jgi:hypothetical protein
MASEGALFGMRIRQSGRTPVERGLKLVSAIGQTICNNRLHARLPESTARLLVGQYGLQGDDLPGERRNIGLRRVNDRQPLLQLGKIFMRGLGLLRHGLANAVGHSVQPLTDRLRHFRLAGAENFGHGLHAALHF